MLKIRKKRTDKVIKLSGTPSKKQEIFLKSKSKYVAYGGARGGGKSWALRRKCILLALHYDGIQILILRKTFQELRENHTIPLKRELGDFVDYNSEEKAFYFPNGSRIKLGYCDDDSDVNQYQGQEYDIIAMDEGTQFSEYQFTCLNACLRGTNKKFPKRFYITCNPGGVGHAWVKRLFIDKRYRKGEKPENYSFIPAKVYDNDYIMKNNPDYVGQLESLPKELRLMWLDGVWDGFAGQFFKEFNRDIHVVIPTEIPTDAKRYLAIDYGLDMLAALWIAVTKENEAFVYREVYKSGLVVSDAAKEILNAEAKNENIYLRLAPPDLWGRTKDTGLSVIDIFANNGLYFCKADNSRTQGWMTLREWLKPIKDDRGRIHSKLKIFETCPNLIRTLPLLQYDKKNLNDVANEPHELTHAPDALRYFASFRTFENNEVNKYQDFESEKEDDNNVVAGLWR